MVGLAIALSTGQIKSQMLQRDPLSIPAQNSQIATAEFDSAMDDFKSQMKSACEVDDVSVKIDSQSSKATKAVDTWVKVVRSERNELLAFHERVLITLEKHNPLVLHKDILAVPDTSVAVQMSEAKKRLEQAQADKRNNPKQDDAVIKNLEDEIRLLGDMDDLRKATDVDVKAGREKLDAAVGTRKEYVKLIRISLSKLGEEDTSWKAYVETLRGDKVIRCSAIEQPLLINKLCATDRSPHSPPCSVTQLPK
jgi:hypothetical protein